MEELLLTLLLMCLLAGAVALAVVWRMVRWVVAGAYPAKWTGPELDAAASAVAAESVAFVHRGVTRL